MAFFTVYHTDKEKWVGWRRGLNGGGNWERKYLWHKYGAKMSGSLRLHEGQIFSTPQKKNLGLREIK